MPPSGSSTETVQDYYEHLWSGYLRAQSPLQTGIDWGGPFWIGLFATILIGFFYLYSFHFQHVHRRHGEMYGVASFAGAILERIGRISLFDGVVWAVVVVWAGYLLITQILFGQSY